MRGRCPFCFQIFLPPPATSPRVLGVCRTQSRVGHLAQESLVHHGILHLIYGQPEYIVAQLNFADRLPLYVTEWNLHRFFTPTNC